MLPHATRVIPSPPRREGSAFLSCVAAAFPGGHLSSGRSSDRCRKLLASHVRISNFEFPISVFIQLPPRRLYSTSSGIVTVTGDAPSSSLLDTTLTVGYSVNSKSAQTPATRAITIRIFRFLQQGTIQVIPQNGNPNYGNISYVYYTVITNPGAKRFRQDTQASPYYKALH